VHVTDLNLSLNKLDHLPDEITALTSLRRLNLEHNNLSRISDAVGDLILLEVLVLSFNFFVAGPDAFRTFYRLRELRFDNNELDVLSVVWLLTRQGIDDPFESLESLELLVLDNNKVPPPNATLNIKDSVSPA
jgi:Leucine-rich repeat (LRR) protein